MFRSKSKPKVKSGTPTLLRQATEVSEMSPELLARLTQHTQQQVTMRVQQETSKYLDQMDHFVSEIQERLCEADSAVRRLEEEKNALTQSNTSLKEYISRMLSKHNTLQDKYQKVVERYKHYKQLDALRSAGIGIPPPPPPLSVDRKSERSQSVKPKRRKPRRQVDADSRRHNSEDSVPIAAAAKWRSPPRFKRKSRSSHKRTKSMNSSCGSLGFSLASLYGHSDDEKEPMRSSQLLEAEESADSSHMTDDCVSPPSLQRTLHATKVSTSRLLKYIRGLPSVTGDSLMGKSPSHSWNRTPGALGIDGCKRLITLSIVVDNLEESRHITFAKEWTSGHLTLLTDDDCLIWQLKKQIASMSSAQMDDVIVGRYGECSPDAGSKIATKRFVRFENNDASLAADCGIANMDIVRVRFRKPATAPKTPTKPLTVRRLSAACSLEKSQIIPLCSPSQVESLSSSSPHSGGLKLLWTDDCEPLQQSRCSLTPPISVLKSPLCLGTDVIEHQLSEEMEITDV